MLPVPQQNTESTATNPNFDLLIESAPRNRLSASLGRRGSRQNPVTLTRVPAAIPAGRGKKEHLKGLPPAWVALRESPSGWRLNRSPTSSTRVHSARSACGGPGEHQVDSSFGRSRLPIAGGAKAVTGTAGSPAQTRIEKQRALASISHGSPIRSTKPHGLGWQVRLAARSRSGEQTRGNIESAGHQVEPDPAHQVFVPVSWHRVRLRPSRTVPEQRTNGTFMAHLE